jgi:hypothetical protein
MGRLNTLMAALALVALISAAAPAVASWEFEAKENPMDGSKRGFATVKTTNGGLIVKCDSEGSRDLYAQFSSDAYLGYSSSSSFRPFKYRFDDGEVRTIEAYYDSHIAVVSSHLSKKDFDQFFTSLFAAKKLAVELDNQEGVPTYLVLEVAGAKEPVQQAAAACGDAKWSAP